MQKNISPHHYALATISVALIAYGLFFFFEVARAYFFLPIVALALLYALLNTRANHLAGRTWRRTTGFKTLLRKAFARYLVWLVCIFLGYTLYRLTPYYSTPPFAETVDFFALFLKAHAVFGLPYFIITLYFRDSAHEDYYDPAIRLLHIAKQVTLRTLTRHGLASILRVFKKKYNRKVLLTLLMRAYFMPVMISQVYANMAYAIGLGKTFSMDPRFIVVILWLSALIWLTDTINASLAYCFESRWLDNRTRSIDMTLSGWVVCLFCYSPLNMITSMLFPFAPVVVNNDPGSLVYANMTLFYIVKLVQVSLLALHVYIDLSLGPSVANISFKKLQTRGAYGVVRHPGTVTKLTFWLLISGFYTGFWHTKMILGQLAWSTIYVLRALTEERHLKGHSAYQVYMKKVKYRFIPGLL